MNHSKLDIYIYIYIIQCQRPRRGFTCNHKSMPLSQTGSYSHTYIGVTY
ncbi:hypothetical protein F383_23060 [Gossypium arboreum]|uniref:Uncharacterized protein n=1 Tax=Gossypium arboreum TaxID=29729 RepID=A0A0B0P1X7_GOSAR|nr:hypothetical protein F383_23060 [Gossypium arboreum]